MLIFAVTVFCSAFLLFSIQPMIAKFLLPAFGGTAAVWATCLVFFQTLLLAGYAYAHLIRSKLNPPRQRIVHLAVLALSLLFLPPRPVVEAATEATATPVWELLRCLLSTVGGPFFALSATAPLLMEWFRQSFPQRSPDRLYAVSNAGSLLALLSYPLLLEPNFSRQVLANAWAGGLMVFLLFCATVAWRTRLPVRPEPPKVRKADPQTKIATTNATTTPGAPSWWIALAAGGTALLLALTNQISQDVAPMPLLWVAPMAIYLITFILCFEYPRCYHRAIFLPASFVALLVLAWLLKEGFLLGFWVQVGSYLTVLFLGCMACHGELYRLRPPAERLTLYYLAISCGGALGGMFVALAAPAIFRTLLETPIIAIAIATLITLILGREVWSQKGKADSRQSRYALAALVGGLLVVAGHVFVQLELRKESIHYSRNFYGVYRVTESPRLLFDHQYYALQPGVARVLHSGQIYHGLQFTAPAAAGMATAYYCEEGGLGVAFRHLPAQTNRHVGIVGLGVGTAAAYGKTGDRLRFYELNPAVLEIARNQFTFLQNCPAQVEVVLGDGRLSLEREAAQGFDLLILDAFAGDSVPAHLLTVEAMRLYARHLKPTGVMAFHISNSHLDLEPIVRSLAKEQNMAALLFIPGDLTPTTGKMVSYWMLVSANGEFFRHEGIKTLPNLTFGRPPLLWTDDHSSVIPLLK